MIGVEVDRGRLATLRAGRSCIQDVPDAGLADVAARLRVTDDAIALHDADAITICVPTPMTRNREPDTSYIRETAEAIAA